MTIDHLKERLPDHAKDLRINLGVITGESSLSPRQHWGTALAAAVTTRHGDVIRAIAAAAAPHLDEAATRAAHSAASVMAMNNIYYRFLHATEGGEYGRLPARLRMQAIGNPGVDHVDFELWCLAASAITGCGKCMTSHEQVVRGKGASATQVQDAVRIAAIVHALAVTLDGAAALAT